MKKITLYFFILTSFVACGDKEDSLGLKDGVEDGDHRIFVTSSKYDGAFASGKADSLEEADSICNSHAATAGLVRTYKAILSDENNDAYLRLNFTGKVSMVEADEETTQEVVASGIDLWLTGSKNMLAGVDLDENGASVSGNVWTGTGDTGAVTTSYCDNWSNTSLSGTIGTIGEPGADWIESSFMICGNSFRLYCVSQD